MLKNNEQLIAKIRKSLDEYYVETIRCKFNNNRWTEQTIWFKMMFDHIYACVEFFPKSIEYLIIHEFNVDDFSDHVLVELDLLPNGRDFNADLQNKIDDIHQKSGWIDGGIPRIIREYSPHVLKDIYER